MHNSHLVEIFNENQQLFISQEATKIGSFYWWIGLTDDAEAGVWRWDHAGRVASYTYWDSGNPETSSTHNWAFIMDTDHRWRDWDAANCYAFCQFNPFESKFLNVFNITNALI